jgi:hypothetical protein
MRVLTNRGKPVGGLILCVSMRYRTALVKRHPVENSMPLILLHIYLQ